MRSKKLLRSPKVDSRRKILVDVDGVLNAFNGPNTYWNNWTELTSPGGFTVHVSSDMAAAIKEVADKYDRQIIWCTTWLQMPKDLAEIAEAIGWPEFHMPVAPARELPAPKESKYIWRDWKLDIARSFGPESEWVWIDDDPRLLDSQVLPNREFGVRPRDLALLAFEIELADGLIGAEEVA